MSRHIDVTAPSLLRRAERLVRDESLWCRGDHVLCAVSGGPDSMAMAHVVHRLVRRLGHRVSFVGVDHGLRSEAIAELELVERLGTEHDVPFISKRVTVAPGSNLQARARQARHQALQQVAAQIGANVIALGHTADDRAETVMIRMLRGSGPRGLAAMGASAEGVGGATPLVRPLLTARRSDVLAHLKRHRVGFAHDPSNDDRRFLRVRVRHELMPLLEELSPGVVGHLCALAQMLETDPRADPLEGLNRAQRLAIERARKLGKPKTTVRVSGGRDLEVRFFGKTAVLRTDK